MPRKELNSNIRKRIIQFSNDGQSVRDISRRLIVAKSTVQAVIQRFRATGSTVNQPRTGRPRKTSATNDNHIRCMVKRNPKIAAPEINQTLQEVGVSVSDQTVRNRIHEAGLRGYRAKKKPLISAKNRKARLEFARNHVDKPVSFWDKVIWTDETKINMFQSDGAGTVWRPSGKADDPRYTTPTVKYGGGNIMAWACISSRGPGDLIFIDDVNENASMIMTGETYRDILKTYVQPNATKLVGRNFVLQADNDPKHAANATKELISKKKWKVLAWPSQSPDLNPIEHTFHLLKEKMRSQKPSSKAQLKEMALKAWNSLQPSQMKKLVHSMPRRLRAVIANKGYATKY